MLFNSRHIHALFCGVYAVQARHEAKILKTSHEDGHMCISAKRTKGAR